MSKKIPAHDHEADTNFIADYYNIFVNILKQLKNHEKYPDRKRMETNP